MHSIMIHFRIDRDSLDPELFRGPHYAARNLAAVLRYFSAIEQTRISTTNRFAMRILVNNGFCVGENTDDSERLTGYIGATVKHG